MKDLNKNAQAAMLKLIHEVEQYRATNPDTAFSVVKGLQQEIYELREQYNNVCPRLERVSVHFYENWVGKQPIKLLCELRFKFGVQRSTLNPVDEFRKEYAQ